MGLILNAKRGNLNDYIANKQSKSSGEIKVKKIKVLQSIDSLGIGGNEIFTMNFFRHIDKSKFQVDFVIYDSSRMIFYNEVVEMGSRLYVCRQKYANKYLQLLSQILQIRKILRDNSYDIIHCNSCSFVGILRGAFPGYFAKGIKVVTHAHNPGTPKNTIIDGLFRNILKIVLSHISDLGFACSESCGKSKYTKKFREGANYSIINNAIEIEKYQFNEFMRKKIRRYFGIEKNFVIGSIGRLEEQKNYLFLIDVLEEYLKKHKICYLLLVGDGSQKEQIIKKAQSKGIENYLIMVGQTEHPECYYSAMDVFVLPSIYEGFGLVNIEAQVSGLSCIVSDAVPQEIDISGRVTFLKQNVVAWCEKLYEIEKGYSTQDRKMIFSDKYNIQDEVKRLESFYKSLSA